MHPTRSSASSKLSEKATSACSRRGQLGEEITSASSRRGQLGEATTSAHSEREQHESEAEVDEATTSMAMEYHTTRVAAVESREVASEAEMAVMANFTAAIMSSMAAKRGSNGGEAAAGKAVARTATVASFGGGGWHGVGRLTLVEDVDVAKVWKIVGGNKTKVQTEAAARGKLLPSSP